MADNSEVMAVLREAKRLAPRYRTLTGCKPAPRLGSIDVTEDWHSMLLVLLDQNSDALEIYQGDRDAVLTALSAPGSRAHHERGALGVRKFKSIGRRRWPRAQPRVSSIPPVPCLP